MGVFRMVGCVYIMLFYNIVNREIKKNKKTTWKRITETTTNKQP